MQILPRSFYQRDTVLVAQELLGKVLVREVDGKILSGIITETESYCCHEPASHSHRGKSESNKAMFNEVGHAYIYFIYGNYFCFNVVAKENKEYGAGVLIRAIKPLIGIEHMIKNRKIKDLNNLTNGPGKLTLALDINKNLYGIDLTKKGPLYITEGIDVDKKEITATPRVGISKATDKLWRFYIKI
jgi:DNA-3-methyladenine glycosylase